METTIAVLLVFMACLCGAFAALCFNLATGRAVHKPKVLHVKLKKGIDFKV